MTKVLIFAYFVKNLIEMRGAGDIVAISIPFTAGVVAAAVLPPGGDELNFAVASCCSAALAVLCLSMAASHVTRLSIMSVFFLAGIMSYISSSCWGTPHTEVPWAKKALEDFCSLLDSIGFESNSTGPLAKALLTGQREDVGKEIVESFRKSGASHILALSGLHLGVIYGILRKSLAILGNSRPAAIIKCVAIISASGFYTAMTGASPSIVRAFLFISLRELSHLLPGRRHGNIHIYCTALTVQLCLNPTVIDSIGFRLSYLAMLGIFTIFPKLEAWYPGSSAIDPIRMIWKSAAMSVSCQIFTAPLVWHTFHTFPSYFLLTNLLALPLTEAFITSAVVTAALSAAGFCPEMAKGLTDQLGQALISCLDIISGM